MVVSAVGNRDYCFALLNIVYMCAEHESIKPVLCFHCISRISTTDYLLPHFRLNLSQSIFR